MFGISIKNIPRNAHQNLDLKFAVNQCYQSTYNTWSKVKNVFCFIDFLEYIFGLHLFFCHIFFNLNNFSQLIFFISILQWFF